MSFLNAMPPLEPDGEEAARKAMAVTMQREGIPAEQAAKIAGLPVEVVRTPA